MKIGIIGGINIDIEGRPYTKIKYHDSNPGRIKLSYGGVGRNIAENLARLGADCSMISVVSDDPMSMGALKALEDAGVDVSLVRVMKGAVPSIYLSILDNGGDMELGLSDMDIIKTIDADFIESIRPELMKKDTIALDGNLTREVLDYATGALGHAKLFYDPVSAKKAVREGELIGRFFAVKPNVIEAETMLGMKIRSDGDVRAAAKRFAELGVRQVYISLGKDGVFFREEGDEGFLRPDSKLEIRSATGAGDSFSACVLLGMSRGLPARETAAMGMAASAITMRSQGAVSEEMNPDSISEYVKRRENHEVY